MTTLRAALKEMTKLDSGCELTSWVLQPCSKQTKKCFFFLCHSLYHLSVTVCLDPDVKHSALSVVPSFNQFPKHPEEDAEPGSEGQLSTDPT